MAESNDKLLKRLKVIIEILIVFVAIAVSFVTIRERTVQNCEKIGKLEKKTENVSTQTTKNKEELIELKTDVKYIKKGIDDIKSELKK